MEENLRSFQHLSMSRRSRQVADMAVEYGAEKMIMVSTDKVVNPTNVIRMFKRLAEIYVQSLGCAIREGKIKRTY